MTSQSPRIYIYKITFEEVSYYYYGVHKEKKFGEYYMGSPKTHKWCWELYTPKKQILQLFDFTDEGWLKALEVEMRLIKPFYQTDKWCLNESCGGRISLKISRKNGKKNRQFGKGIFALSIEQRKENGRKYGPKAGFISGKKQYKNKIGMFSLTPEQMRENCRKGGKISGKINGNRAKELGLGMFALTEEEKQEARRKGRESTNSQRWQCKETGYISTAAGVVSYQKGKKIDTSKNNRIRLS